MHRSRLMHLRHCSEVSSRVTPWWLAVGVTVAVVAAGCTSGSASEKATSFNPAAPAVSNGAVSVPSGFGTSAVDVGANVFTCPSAAEINSLTAMGFNAAGGNGAGHCEYIMMSGSTQSVRVTINHPPASATNTRESLAHFKAAAAAVDNVVLTTAPQYSADSFIARFGTLSCSVFALARDGAAMQVQASHQAPGSLDNCALAQSVTAVAGTSTRAATAPTASNEVVMSPTEDSPPAVSPVPSTSVTASPTPTTAAPTTGPTTRSTGKGPTTPTSTSEVLIFSTGPAASVTLPTKRPATTTR